MALAHFQRTFTGPTGVIQPDLSVTIRNEATGALAAIYTDKDGNTSAGNPLKTDATGYLSFYARPGRYRITATDIDWRDEDLVTHEALDEAVELATMAADAASLNAGVYFSTNEGLAATDEGAYFSVPSAEDDEYLILYRKENGTAAEIDIYPNKQALKSILSARGICNASDFGASYTASDNGPAINAALAACPHVYVGTGAEILEIRSAIRIPSGRTLEFHPAVTLKLANGASDYLITNDDLVAGNENIRVIGNGAKIDGNKPGGQVRDYSAPAYDRASYWGFGMWFVNVQNLEVDGFLVNETESWGVGYWNVTRGRFANLRFWQTTEPGQNGDGVTGVGSDILIENISGYTNDDMVFAGNAGGSLLGNDMGMEQLASVRRITVRHIRPETRDGFATWRAVRLGGRSPDGGVTRGGVFGVIVSDVRGETRHDIIEVANNWAATHPGLSYYNLKIEDIEREYFPGDAQAGAPHINIENVTIRDLSISDWRAYDTAGIPGFLDVKPTAEIEVLKVLNAHMRDEHEGGELVLVADRGKVRTVTMDACTGERLAAGTTNGRLYFKYSTTSPKTRLRFSSSYTERYHSQINSPFSCVSGALLAMSGTSDMAQIDRLTPDKGDALVDIEDGTLKSWTGSAWV